MSLKEFCDTFNAKWKRGDEPNSYDLELAWRTYKRDTTYHPIRLVPHLTTKKANPKMHKYFLLYCKHLSLWLIPCKNIIDLLPQSNMLATEFANLTEEGEAEYWKKRYYGD